MNTIEHEGKTYELLTLDRISEITHAKLAGGKVVEATPVIEEVSDHDSVYLHHHDRTVDKIWASSLEPLGIQPLRLVPREPVTFEGTIYEIVGNPYILAPAGTPFGKRFRCVEIVEEAK